MCAIMKEGRGCEMMKLTPHASELAPTWVSSISSIDFSRGPLRESADHVFVCSVSIGVAPMWAGQFNIES